MATESDLAKVHAEAINSLRKTEFSPQDREKKRAEITLMHDRLVEAVFIDNKNNGIITDAANIFRKIYDLPPIPAINRTTTQKSSMIHYWERKMIADLLSGHEVPTKSGALRGIFNVTIEIQNDPQAGFDTRAILSFGNALREGFIMGSSYTMAPDTMGINILGYNLPSHSFKKEFYSRKVITDHDYPERFFLDDKFSIYFAELTKLGKKSDWGEKYHELWDLCAVFRHKLSEYDEVMKMVASPVAQALMRETQKAAGHDTVIDEVLADDKVEMYISGLLADSEQKRIADIEKMVELINSGVPAGEASRRILSGSH